MQSHVAATYRPLFRNAFTIIIGLAIVFAAMRGIGMLGPPGARMALPLGFVCMMILPFVLLNKDGRSRVGFRKSRPGFYTKAVAWGIMASAFCFATGWLLFGSSADNWYLTIRNSYMNTFPTQGMSMLSLFFTFTIPALIFSPLGEEIFFRGMLQEALHERFTIQTAMVIEAAVFGVVHLAHHGLVRTAEGIRFFPVSGALWMLLMFATASGFAWLRERSGSLYPAMVSHVFFNLTMNLFIFLALWRG